MDFQLQLFFKQWCNFVRQMRNDGFRWIVALIVSCCSLTAYEAPTTPSKIVIQRGRDRSEKWEYLQSKRQISVFFRPQYEGKELLYPLPLPWANQTKLHRTVFLQIR